MAKTKPAKASKKRASATKRNQVPNVEEFMRMSGLGREQAALMRDLELGKPGDVVFAGRTASAGRSRKKGR